MKSMIIFACLLATAYAGLIYSAPSVAHVSNYAYQVPQTHFTRTDWKSGGHQVAIPAVARYAVVNPGVTTYHAAPLVYRAHSVPVVAHSGHYVSHSAPLLASHTLLAPAHVTSSITKTVHYNKKA